MPLQPPRFGQAAQPRKAWAAAGPNAKRRLRGRAGVRDRQRILAEEPCCRVCLAEGKVTASEEVDHIDESLPDPLWDARANKQALCKPCHRAKTEAAKAGRPSSAFDVV